MKLLLLLLALATTAFGVITPADYTAPITADGDYSFPASVPAGNVCTYTLTGTFSGGLVTIGYITPAGEFTSLSQTFRAPGTSTASAIPLGPIPGKATPAVTLSGSVSPRITLTVTQINPGTQPLNAGSIVQALGYTPADAGSTGEIADITGLQTALDGKARKSDVTQLRKRVCATRSRISTNTLAGGATQTETSSFTVLMTDDAWDIEVGFANPNDGLAVTIKAAAEINGVIHPLYFNGSRTTVLNITGIAFTDPLGLYLPKGTTVKIRTYADAGSGNTVQPNLENYNASLGGKIANVDYADSGTITATTAYMFGPSLIVGKCLNPCILFVSDSIGDANPGGLVGASWLRQNYGTYAADGYNCGKTQNILHMAEGGRSFGVSNANNWWWMTRLFEFCDIGVVSLGVNDLLGAVSAADLQTRMQYLWGALNSRGMPVWAATVTGRTTSTDSWATVANQTVNGAPAFSTTKRTVNDWIKTTPSPLVGYIDIEAAVMDATDLTKWKAGGTTDGLHPTYSVLLADMIAAIPADLLTRGR